MSGICMLLGNVHMKSVSAPVRELLHQLLQAHTVPQVVGTMLPSAWLHVRVRVRHTRELLSWSSLQWLCEMHVRLCMSLCPRHPKGPPTTPNLSKARLPTLLPQRQLPPATQHPLQHQDPAIRWHPRQSLPMGQPFSSRPHAAVPSSSCSSTSSCSSCYAWRTARDTTHCCER